MAPRHIVTFAIAGWSVFTALTATAWSFVSLIAIRFTFGALEAAFSPSVASAFSRWVPVNERATAFGAFLGGGRLGGAITPPIAGLLVLHYGWRIPFVVFGAFGLLWSVLWYAWYRNSPEEHPAVKPPEQALIAKTTHAREASECRGTEHTLRLGPACSVRAACGACSQPRSGRRSCGSSISLGFQAIFGSIGACR